MYVVGRATTSITIELGTSSGLYGGLGGASTSRDLVFLWEFLRALVVAAAAAADCLAGSYVVCTYKVSSPKHVVCANTENPGNLVTIVLYCTVLVDGWMDSGLRQ